MATHEIRTAIMYDEAVGSINMLVNEAQIMKTQATGSGSYTVYGRLSSIAEYKALTGIDVSTLDVVVECHDDSIYEFDIAGLYDVKVDYVDGVKSVRTRMFSTS